MGVDREIILRLLTAHGYAPDVAWSVVKTISAEHVAHHAEKAIIEVHQGEKVARLFVNNAGVVWPSTERLEARLSAMIHAHSMFPEGVQQTMLVAPLRTKLGTVCLTDTPHRWYLSPVAVGTDLEQLVQQQEISQPQALILLSRALGGYHHIVSRTGPPPAAGVGDVVRLALSESGERMAATYRAWATGDYSSITWAARITTLDRRLMEGAWEVLNFLITQDRLAAIDALPRTWIHDDFQFKNIVFEQGQGSARGDSRELSAGDRLSVIDINDGSYASRLFDFFFLVTQGVDAGPFPDTAAINRKEMQTLFQHYLDGGGTQLTPEEVHLLPNALQLKAMAIAEYFARWSPDSDAHEKCTRLLAWVGIIAESRNVLREVAPRD
eukprot:m.79227 g.79227  ORF g.79227 m.79227 type:complete len:382 (+) comp13274_c0_seq3:840-1985(+)